MRGGASLMVKKDGMILELPSLMVKKDGMILEKQHRRAVTSSLFGQERGLVRDVAYLFHILPHYLAYYETNHRIHTSLD